jgi:two-component system cell cycle sensor histidine kinase/response regulator CckA
MQGMHMGVHVSPESVCNVTKAHACFRTAMRVPLQKVEGETMADIFAGRLETILVVDDNEATCKVVVAVLEQAHFRVLSADNATNAIELANQTAGRIDLLLSDVDMPSMSGPDLGLALKKTRPDLHVMLMSGGENGNLLVLNYGWAFIQKPFVAPKLVQMVNDVLHSPDRSQPGGQEFDSRRDAH